MLRILNLVLEIVRENLEGAPPRARGIALVTITVAGAISTLIVVGTWSCAVLAMR